MNPPLAWKARGIGLGLVLALLAPGCGDGGGSEPAAPVAPTPAPAPAPTPEPEPEPPPEIDRFAHWNDLPAEPWWRESAPYSCREEANEDSPWAAAGLPDLGGSDPLSLIRFFGNGIYLRYRYMKFGGCTASNKDPDGFLPDPPADPTYYTKNNLEITVDVARVPVNAGGWVEDDRKRVDMSLSEAVTLLNRHVTAYYRRLSGGQFRITFVEGEEFTVPGDGSSATAETHQQQLVGACLEECRNGAPGGLNRILLSDVNSFTGGVGINGWAHFGLASLEQRRMATIVHEIGHGWMEWAHSFPELPWRPYPGRELEQPNPYSNLYDIMSETLYVGWDPGGIPSTMAINRYSAGWIPPEEVALHLEENGVYTLARPGYSGNQFLVVHSGRRHAFTTLEVLDEIGPAHRLTEKLTFDPTAPGRRRALRYEGVLVSRFDQTSGTGTSARLGPALYNADNPDYLTDVGWGRDDESLLSDGASRDIGGGVTVSVSRNGDGSYEVSVTGGRIAAFEPWCVPLWFRPGTEYDSGCFLDSSDWE